MESRLDLVAFIFDHQEAFTYVTTRKELSNLFYELVKSTMSIAISKPEPGEVPDEKGL